MHSLLLLKNNCHGKMCVVCAVFNLGIDSIDAYINTIINSQEDSEGIHFTSINFQYSYNGHYRWYTFTFFQLFYLCVLHPSRWTLYIQFEFVDSSPYSWVSINDCIMKTQSELWQSFSITIWRTGYINITCCLSLSSWICPTYSCIFYIVIF